jgi:hypothetical protein
MLLILDLALKNHHVMLSAFVSKGYSEIYQTNSSAIERQTPAGKVPRRRIPPVELQAEEIGHVA